MYMQVYVNILGKWHKLESFSPANLIEDKTVDDFFNCHGKDFECSQQSFYNVTFKGEKYRLHRSHFTFVGE